MKGSLKKFLFLSMIFALVFSSFTSVASANEAKEVENLAEQLEFLFEEAAVKDNFNNIVDFDIEKLERKYGTSPELKELESVIYSQYVQPKRKLVVSPVVKNDNLITPNHHIPEPDEFDYCLQRKITKNFKEVFSVNAIATIVSLIHEKQYTKAAGKLIKMGVKGNVFALAGQIAWYWGQCAIEVSK